VKLKESEMPLAGGVLRTTQLPAVPAFRLGLRVSRIIAPVIGKAGIDWEKLMSGQQAANDLDIELNTVVPGFLGAVGSIIDPDDFVNLAKEILVSSSWTDGKTEFSLANDIGINAAFSSDLSDLFKAVWFAAKANNFFGLGAIGKLRQIAQAVSSKPASPGQ
jgi:hypothetical protein